MEVTITDEGTFEFLFDKWDIFVQMLGLGFTIALSFTCVVVMIVASIKLGWYYWTWALGVGALAFLFF